MMSRTQKFRTPSGRKLALSGLVAVLALLFTLPRTASVPASNAEGPAWTAKAQSPISNSQSLISISYSYDDAGRLVQANYGSGVGLNYDYDAAGNLVGVSPGGEYNVYLPLVLRSRP